jgi:hypothetical protein
MCGSHHICAHLSPSVQTPHIRMDGFLPSMDKLNQTLDADI